MSLNEQKNLGEKIRQARVMARINQTSLAKIIGIGRNSMIETEKGRRVVSVIELNKISKATNQPLSFFYDEDEKPKSKSTGRLLDTANLTDEQIDLIQKLIDTCTKKESADPKNGLKKSAG